MSTQLRPRNEPLRDLATFRDEIERFFREGVGSDRPGLTTATGWSPLIDLEETADAYQLHVELPGIEPEDISVSVEDDVLTISGERRFYEEKESDGFQRIERRFGSFHRSTRLPGKIDADGVDATYAGGVLHVTVPKPADTRPHRVEVKPG